MFKKNKFLIMDLNLCSKELTNENPYTLYSVLDFGRGLIMLQIFSVHTHTFMTLLFIFFNKECKLGLPCHYFWLPTFCSLKFLIKNIKGIPITVQWQQLFCFSETVGMANPSIIQYILTSLKFQVCLTITLTKPLPESRELSE